MKNGYYLSAYLHIDPLYHFINVPARHDQNLSLFLKQENKITLVKTWEIERLTGIKHFHKSFFDKAHAMSVINTLLMELNISLNDIVEIWGTPEIQTVDDYHSCEEYPNISYHSISHLFSSLLMDTDQFYNSTIISLAVDGGSDSIIDEHVRQNKKYYCGCVSVNGKVTIVPIASPGHLWYWASEHFRLKEGTLMALATASTSEYFYYDQELILIEDWNSAVNKKAQNSIALEFIKSLETKVSRLVVQDQDLLFNGFDERFTEEENKISMVMKIIQKLSNQIMEYTIDSIIQKFQIDPKESYLSLSGGFSLNCPTNSHLMGKYQFKGFIAPPCVSDCGMSIGIGLYAFYKKNGGQINFKLSHAYYGNTDLSHNAVFEDSRFIQYIEEVSEMDLEQIFTDLERQPVVWFNGSAEIGPRALGNRSLIGDPRVEETKTFLNIVKQREWWRPVAPIVLEEDVHDWFENAYRSPFMLQNFYVNQMKRIFIPAICHLDGSARVQTLNSADNPALYEVIKHFKSRTGIPILCNTSLNDRGEPIIDTVSGAISFALIKGIEVAYINGKRVKLINHQLFERKKTRTRNVDFVYYSEIEYTLVNPWKIHKETLENYLKMIEEGFIPRGLYEPTNKNDAEKIKRIVKFSYR
ncbi:Decarbamoylnovobiocin carbamoyltransferase [compost metagenome]